MSNTDADFRQSLVAAVQAELERHASSVVAEVDRLREQNERERREMRADFTKQIEALQNTLQHTAQHVAAKAEADVERARATVEQRLTEAETRQTRRLEDMTSGIDATVLAAARPLLEDVKSDHEDMGVKVDHLESQLRKFDEQAARMVTYFNDVSQRMEAKQDELAQTVATDVASQIASLRQVVADNESSLRRFQTEVNQSVTKKMTDAEERITTKLVAAESRMKDDNTQRIAEIDARVTRASTGLDETMGVLNDRISSMDDRFINADRRVGVLEESVKGIDQDALEVLKNKMSAAAGEAMLVRIEMERFEKTTNERADTLAVRVTEVETQLQDATMDVSTAVQLDRLEEIERALIELDPNKFVLKVSPPPADTPSQPGLESGLGTDATGVGESEPPLGWD
ncbi:MAG TPA: hypothetical protein VMM60_14960 [Ilumatobacter sp.]|nr:hypothetical protein [Ilumatobacter sp.]